MIRYASLSILALVGGGFSGCSDTSGADARNPAGSEDCDLSVVLCRSLPPPCPPGEVPTTSGTCWSGACVKASACRNLNDCALCNPEWYACATFPRSSLVRCVEVPSVCSSDRSCECLRPHVCPGYGCIRDENEYMCDCPYC